MKKIKFLLLVSIIFLLGGCWNYNELNELAIITGISIDKDENDYVITYMISNSSKSNSKSGDSQSETVLYEGKGESITKATENIHQKLPKIPYISHIDVVVMSDKIAEEGMLNVMDFLLRNPESRKEIYLLISKGVKASDTLSILTPLESFPSENIKSNITASFGESSTTTTIKYSDFLNELLEKGIEPSLGVIEVEGDIKGGQSEESNKQSKQDAIIKLTTTAIFNKDKLIYITNEEESTAIGVLTKRLNNIYIYSTCDNNSIVSYISSISVNTDIKIEDNKPKAIINVKGDGTLLEANCAVDLEDTKVIKKLQKQFEEEFKNTLYKGIDVAKEYKTDILGMGNILYKSNPKYFSKIEQKWNEEIFPDLDIEIKVSINPASKGSLEQTIKEELK